MESAIQILSNREFMNGVKSELILTNDIASLEGDIRTLNNPDYNPYKKRERELLKQKCRDYSVNNNDDITNIIKNLIKNINKKITENNDILIENKKIYSQSRLFSDINQQNSHIAYYPTGRKSPSYFYNDFEKNNMSYKNDDNTLISSKSITKLIDKLYIIECKQLQKLVDKYNNSYN